MSNEERIAKLEAQVLAQQALLTALVWKLAKPSDPVSRLFSGNYAAISRQLNSTETPQAELAAELRTAVDTLSKLLPSNI